MSTTLDGGGGVEVLDLLFSDHEGILGANHTSHMINKTATVDMTLDDLSTDLLNFLNDGTFNDSALDMAEIAETHIHESQKKILESAETDHQYCSRTNSSSDSGIYPDGSLSPGHFSDSLSVNDRDSVFSGGQSPAQYEDTSSHGSPLGGNIEDLQFGDLNFDGLDASLLSDEDFLNSLNSLTNPDITLDLTDKVSDSNDDIDDVPIKKQKLTTWNTDDLDHIDIMDDDDSQLSGLPFHIQDIVKGESQLQELSLSDEEKTLLAREGYAIPTHLPLTKEEERTLKAVRRKIRNKESAKESRKRKQEYMAGLEKRVKVCTAQNMQLQKKVTNLEKQNITLITQLKKLQNLVTSASNKPAQTSTCIMVLLLSFALLIVPNINPFFKSDGRSNNQIAPGRSRSILSANSESDVEQASLKTEESVVVDEQPIEKMTRSFRAETPKAFNMPSSVVITEISDEEAMDVNVTDTDSEPDGDPPFSPTNSNFSDSDIPDDIKAVLRAQELEASIREDHSYSKAHEPWTPPNRRQNKEADSGGQSIRDTDL